MGRVENGFVTAGDGDGENSSWKNSTPIQGRRAFAEGALARSKKDDFTRERPRLIAAQRLPMLLGIVAKIGRILRHVDDSREVAAFFGVKNSFHPFADSLAHAGNPSAFWRTKKSVRPIKEMLNKRGNV